MCLLKWNQNSKREGVSHFSEQCVTAVCTGDEDLKTERAFSRWERVQRQRRGIRDSKFSQSQAGLEHETDDGWTAAWIATKAISTTSNF